MKRGRDLEQILTQYTTFVKPAFEEFCLPVLGFPMSNQACFKTGLASFPVQCNVQGAKCGRDALESD